MVKQFCCCSLATTDPEHCKKCLQSGDDGAITTDIKSNTKDMPLEFINTADTFINESIKEG